MAEESRGPASLRARAVANTLEFVRLLARLAPAGAVDEAGGLTMIASGTPFQFLNLACVTRPLADPAAAATRLRRFYAGAGVAGLLFSPDARAEGLAAPLAQAAGLTGCEAVPSMVLAPLRARRVPPPAGLEIRVVDDLATLRRFNDILAIGFALPRDWLASFDDPALLAAPDLTLYLGLLDGAPAGTAMRFTSHRIAGINFVATLPEYRRLGIGAALTRHAALAGRAEGALASALQASESGFPVYQRLGYRHLLDYPAWTV